MRTLVIIAAPLILIALGVSYWYFNFAEVDEIKTMTALETTGDECDAISEKASMNLPEALEFQKLEKAARKVRVLENCMQDRAYLENPAWVKYATPIAKNNAEAEQISFDEAYEKLRRKAMYAFNVSSDKLSYWIVLKKP